MGNLTKTDKTRIELWTARDMDFVIKPELGRSGIGTIPRYTPCVKPVYTNKIKRYLDKMRERDIFGNGPDDKPVCVKLKGMLRYMWRSDVLTKKEYDDARARDRDSLGVLRSKSRGDLDKGDEDSDVDRSSVAASIQSEGRSSPDS